MEFNILKLLTIIFCFSTFLVYIFNKFKIPSILGFLFSGLILGPYGFKILKDVEAIKQVAEIGVILLLFTIGIEFSLKKLLSMKKILFGSGFVQIFLATFLVFTISFLFKMEIKQRVFFGFLIAMSSTAILFKLLQERGEMDAPHGKVMVGISLFQDLFLIPLMLFLPLISKEEPKITYGLLKIFLSLIMIYFIIYGSKYLIPNFFHLIAKTKQRELFILSIISLCLGITFFTSLFGLSLALGAFIAGLLVSGSEYSHQVISDILPFKDSFIGLFFVSLGALLNFKFAFENFFFTILIVFSIVLIKFISGLIGSLVVGTSLKYSIEVGLGIAQIGEFSFILANEGLKLNLISEKYFQVFLFTSLITIFLSPFLFAFSKKISNFIISINFIKKKLKYYRAFEEKLISIKKENHVIIIGFGLNGKNLALALKESSIPFVVLELNIDTVQEAKAKGEPIFYGDGTSKEILNQLWIRDASILVIVISDPIATRRIVSIARKENPEIYIIVRTRYLQEVEDLKKLGADEVIPEEFETSIEIFSRVLHKYNVPYNLILELIEKIRGDGYKMLRSFSIKKPFKDYDLDFLKGLDFEKYIVLKGSLINKSIKEINLRARTGVTILAVERRKELILNPNPEMMVLEGDVLIIYGEKQKIIDAIAYLENF